MSAKSSGTLFTRLRERAGMPFPVFPHMLLRHACGFALANAGHDTRALQAWLGHKNIQHTGNLVIAPAARRYLPPLSRPLGLRAKKIGRLPTPEVLEPIGRQLGVDPPRLCNS
jgi:integrase